MTSVMRHGEATDLPGAPGGTARQDPPAPEPDLWPELIEAARAFRIATEYHDWRGRRVEVSARTLIAVLGAFGVDAGSPEACRTAMAQLRDARFRPLPPCVVIRQEPPI